LICILGPDADRRSALTIVMDMIWKLEESPAVFQVGVPEHAKPIRFQASIVRSVIIMEYTDPNVELRYLGASFRSPSRQKGQLRNDLAYGRRRSPSMPRMQRRK